LIVERTKKIAVRRYIKSTNSGQILNPVVFKKGNSDPQRGVNDLPNFMRWLKIDYALQSYKPSTLINLDKSKNLASFQSLQSDLGNLSENYVTISIERNDFFNKQFENS
jgi:hypothetical protein